jgi:hypothetical protein
MRFSNIQIKKLTITLSIVFAFITFFFMDVPQVKAQAADGGLKISPSKMDIVLPAGSEKTVGLIVDYDKDSPQAQLPNARLIVRLDDWKISPSGEFSFVAAKTTPRSAASWITYGPSEFTLAPGARQVVRFTVSVPKDTQPGDYYLACYVEERTPPPPPGEGQRQLNIKYRFYSLIYVRVPGLTAEGVLQGLETSVQNGLPVIMPKLANMGNSRLRPKHSVEIRDSSDKVVFSTPMTETLVVLGNQSWQMPIPVDAELPIGSYKLAYSVDFGDKKAVQVGKTEFVITNADVAQRRKSNDPNSAQSDASNKKEKQETPANAQKEEITQKSSPNSTSPASNSNNLVNKKTSVSNSPTKGASSLNNFKQ